MLTLLKNIVEVQSKISGLDTQPLQGDEPEQLPSGDVTDAQWEHIQRIALRYGMGIMRDESGVFYVAHPSLGDQSLPATTKAELYQIVCDLAHKEQEKNQQ